MRFPFKALVAIGFAAGGVSSASAMPRYPLQNRLPQPVAIIHEGGYALAPLAFLEFCHKYAGECVDAPSAPIIELTSQSWEAIQRINIEANRKIRPTPEPEGQDSWDLGVREGDCEDYAIEKRHQLLALGYPAGALALTEVTTPYGADHVVLTVRTTRGTFILDNLRSAVLPWTKTAYHFVKMQSSNNIKHWVSIDADPDTAAAVAQLKRPTVLALDTAINFLEPSAPDHLDVLAADTLDAVVTYDVAESETETPEIPRSVVGPTLDVSFVPMPQQNTDQRMAIWNEAVFMVALSQAGSAASPAPRVEPSSLDVVIAFYRSAFVGGAGL
jgi:predicted transglutaminase-like cysteine proteinase